MKMKTRLLVAVSMAAALMLSCGSAQAVHGAHAARTASTPCQGSAVPKWDHVVVIVMENHGYSQVVGHSPYVDSLASQCALATDYHGVSYPSLPNYLALTGGSTFGVHDDKSPSVHRINSQSIFGQVDSRSLQEGMSGNCALSNTGHLYAVKHNPFAYFTPVRALCQQRDVPLTNSVDLSAKYTFITPNLCHDTHTGCSITQGDDYLRGLIGGILASRTYTAGHTALFLTWDTDDRHEGNHVATVVVAPSVNPGTRFATTVNHYDMLATIESMLGVSVLGSGSSMRAGLHL